LKVEPPRPPRTERETLRGAKSSKEGEKEIPKGMRKRDVVSTEKRANFIQEEG